MRWFTAAIMMWACSSALAQPANRYSQVAPLTPSNPNTGVSTPPLPTADFQQQPASRPPANQPSNAPNHLSPGLSPGPASGFGGSSLPPSQPLDSRPPFVPNAAPATRNVAPLVNSPPSNPLNNPSGGFSGGLSSPPTSQPAFGGGPLSSQPLSSQPLSSQPPATQPSATSPPANPYTNRNGAGGLSPTGSSLASSAAASDSQKLMERVLEPATGSQLTGTRLGLSDVIAGATTREQQTMRIDLYWDLCASVADYNLSLRELDDLNRLAARAGSQDRAINDAVSLMRARIETSRRGAVASQMRLADAMNSSTLGLPGDLPLVGEYRTRYADIFGTRTGGEAAELDVLIQYRHGELVAAAEGVFDAQEWFEEVASSPQAGQGTQGVVQALKLLALNRRAFVQVARDYNRRITRYTELASPGRVSNTRLVAMLIKSSAASTATRPASPSSRAVYPPQSNLDAPPATFQGDWQQPSLSASNPLRDAGNPLRDERVAPASANILPLENEPYGDEQSVVTQRHELP